MLHVQAPPQRDWNQALDLLPDGSLIKLVDTVQTAPEVKGHNETHKVLVRHVINEGYVWSTDWQSNVEQAEREFLTYIDGTFADYAHLVDYVEEPRNEYYSQSMGAQQTAERVMWAKACAYVWETVFRPQWPHIQCLIGNQGVGNDIPLGFFEAAYEHGAGIATHAYTHFNTAHTRDPQDFRYHSGRWNWQDEQARANGWEVPIAITEAGPYASTWDGWRSQYVLNGDIDGYVEAMRGTVRDWMTTHAAQSERLLGFCLFTVYDIGWELYQTGQPEINLLAAMIAEEWQPGSEPPPEPEPEPEPRTWDKYVILLPQSATREQYDGAADLAYPTRTEIAFSADSAFARPDNVESHRVGVVAPEEWGGVEALEAWVAEHYAYDPPTEIEYRDWSGGEQNSPFEFAAWPTDYKVVTQRFGANKEYYAQFGIPGGHEGLDIRAPLGSPVYAVYPGTVYRVDGDSSAYGNQVRIEHPDGHKSVYAHLQEALVSVGDEVEVGQQIGRADNTGNIVSGASHLHLTIKKGGVQLSGFPAGVVDPTPFAEAHNPTWP